MSQHHSQKKIFFVGQEVSSESRIALLLADHNRPLSLAGNTLIKGNCILPKAGVKRAYIEGTTFKGEKLIHGQTIHSESSYNYAQLPGVEAIVSLLDEADEFEITGDSLTHSFWNKRPVHLNIEEEILQDVSIEGSVIITSEGYLEIDSSTHLEDVIVIAPSIRINQGFKGSAQFFARDSLVLEEDVTLEYPSVVMVERRNMTDQVQLHIGAGSSVSGLVCLKNSLGSKTSQSLLSTDADSKISGQVFCQGSMDHKGRVYGSVVLDRFLLRTPSSIYENHLLNATIDSRTLPANYGFLNTAGISNEPTCIAKWIH